MVKVTFTLDDTTIATLRQSAARLNKPQSQVVREAIGEYAERVGRLSESERRRLLHVFDTLMPTVAKRPAREVAAEVRAVRTARHTGGRRHPAKRA